ncbi:T9SS type B sorting domain-containing protein [Ferruginibacter sp.]|nr:gliding motility-associated C-terminal domain-containing protein [Ferruginibacter sp.]MBP6477850.1 gliding motility-associated C-terminal domain-containing protein [Chitinophagaceae bacterium]
MKKLITHFLVSLSFMFFSFIPKSSMAQCNTCTFGGTKSPSNTLTPTLCWQTQSGINGGTYAEINIVSGRTYFFSYCTANGGSANFDTRLVLFNGTTYLTCNSDYGCTPATAARVDWTATYTGVVRVRTLRYVSAANQCASTGTGAVLAYKEQCPTLNIPTGTTPGTLTAPGPVITNPITVQWSSSGTTHHVELWDAVTNNQINLPPSADCINGLSYTLPTLPSGQYKWSVHRNQPCGCCEGNPTTDRYFQVGASCTTPGTPASATGTATGQTSANLSWTAGNPVGSPTVTYYWVVGTNPTVTYGNGVAQGTTTSTSVSTNLLTCATQYYLRVYASTSCNNTNSGYRTSASFTTSACNPNCITPGTPATATGTATGQTSANLSWTAGNPAGSPTVTYYWVVGTSATVTYGNGVDQGTTTSTSVSTNLLTCATQYYLRVYASTSCNNTNSGYRTSTSFTTTACNPNCITPGIPASATGTATGQTSANLSWTAGNPAGSPTVTYYWVVGTSATVTYGNGVDQGTTTTLSASTNLLTCATQYYLRLYARTSCNGTNSGYRTSSVFQTQSCNPNCTTPANPANPTSNSPQCNSVTLTRTGTPPSGIIWYWQTTATGTNTSNSGATYVVNTSGTYYLRAYNTANGGCWSTGSGSHTVSVIVCPANNLVIDYGINALVIPPWQRQNDNYDGKVTVIRTGNVNAPWHLEVDVHNSTGTIVENTIQYSSITTSIQFFNTANDVSLRNYSVEGKIMAYYAVLDNSVPLIRRKVFGTSVNINNGLTYIIEKKWDKKNVVYFNNGNEPLKIPVHYDPTYPYGSNLGIQFKRINKVSYTLGLGGTCLALNEPYSIFPPTYPTLNSFFRIENGYMIIDRDLNLSNLKNVLPGEFEYKIVKHVSPQLFSILESGEFDLSKVGKISLTPNTSGKLLIMVGGIFNEMEGSADNLKINAPDVTTNPNSTYSYSVIEFARQYATTKNFSSWYIAQGNANSIKRNGYDIGISLKEIVRNYEFISGTTVNEIAILCHSKGGLDTRCMLGGFNISYNGSKTFPSNSEESTLINKINKVLFFDTPHWGAEIATTATYWCNFGILSSIPGVHDLIPQNSSLIGINSTAMPNHVYFLNMTGYKTFQDLTDQVVKVIESHKPRLFTNKIIQLYQNDVREDCPNASLPCNSYPSGRLHLLIHKSSFLNHNGNGQYVPLNCYNTTIGNNLNKVVNFLNDTYSNPGFLNCYNSIYQLYGHAAGSILSGANVYFIPRGGQKQYLTTTDENGNFNISHFPFSQANDTITVESSGHEKISVVLNNDILSLGHLELPTFSLSPSNNLIKYSSLLLPNQNPITSQPTIQIKVTGQNVNQYFINQHSSDSIFIPLLLSNYIASIPLDSGYNRIVVKFVGADTVYQVKNIYYLPDTLMNEFAMNCIIQTTQPYLNAKLFVDNQFYCNINTISKTIKLLKANNELKFSRFGYKDTLFRVDSTTILNLSMQPSSYSSNTDSAIFNFNNKLNPQYWKAISVKNLSPIINKQVSVMQYDDSYTGMSLKPQTRKFVFRKLGSAAPASFKTAVVFDQIITPDKDSVYLLYKNGNSWVKYQANQTGVSEYDPEVQKLAFEKLYIDDNQTREIVLMKKQAPIMKTPVIIDIHSGETLQFPLSYFVSDPDSIKNDITLSSTDVKVRIVGATVYITAPVGFTGNATFTLTATHDFLDISKDFKMKVLSPGIYVPTGFTPNNDGLNDDLNPKYMGKLLTCHFTLFNRYGQKVFETTDCTKGWDGKINGVEQPTGTFVWMLSYQFDGEAKKEMKGTTTLIR